LEEDQLGDAVKWVVVKDDVSPADIFRLHRGSAADRALVGKYCLQDCDLVLELYRNREVFNNSMSMANVCSVPIGYIFTRGQGIKAESLMFKACRARDTLIPVLPAPNQNGSEDSYEGAIVFDPIPKFYHEHPIGVADFASLYPSSMESENISHDSLVWTKDYDASGSLIAVVFGSDEYDEQPGYGYTDISFDLLRVNPEDKRKHPEKHKAGLRICRYAQPLDGSKATVPEIIRGLLAARKAKRKEKAKETDPAKQALLEAEQLAYKLTANSLYGQLGSSTFKVRLQSLAASITAYGRNQIMFAKEVIDRFYGPEANDPRISMKCEAKVMYGDSVTGDTPLLLQKDGHGVCLRRMDELEGLWAPYHETKEAMVLDPPITVWTEKGWTPLRRVIRHRLAPTKKLFRILTHTGVADVTEDHSLVLANGSEIKPSDVAVGTELLHNDQAFTHCDSSDCDILLGEAFVMGLFVADGSSDVYRCPSGTKASWAINKADHALLEEAGRLCPFPTKILDTLASSGVYKLVPVGSIAEPARKYRQLFYNVHREKRIPESILNAPLAIVEAFWNGFYAGDGDKDEKGFVRIDQKGKEITTGLGLLAMRLGYKVSLTDRLGKQDVFRITMTKGKQRRNPIAIKKIRELPHPGPAAYVYDLETENHHFAVGPGSLIVHNTDSLFIEFAVKDTSLSPRDKRQAVIDLTAEAGKLVTKALAPPHDFEFDKIFDPMLMFSKKRYAGLMFEENADDFVVKYMGIALKRRDNAPIVKTVYGTAMKKLLFERDVVGATRYVQESVMDLINGKVKLGQLTITKSLRAEYANPLQIAHKALADRMALRDPGNAPGSGDRIPFVYVQPPVGKTAAKLQGDRVEAPSWIKEKGLKPDYEFYLTNQIQNPVSQMFGLVLEEMPGSETIPWSKAPEDPEKLLVWRESAAAQILFDRALQACQGHHKTAFVTKFFGPVATVTGTPVVTSTATATASNIKPAHPISVSKSMNKNSTKPKQTTLNTFMMDGFLVKTIEKKERAKKAAKKAAAEATEAAIATQGLKNEIVNE
jgi:DNA polymerase elongation subunit (family B)